MNLTDAEEFAVCVHAYKLADSNYLFFDYNYWERLYSEILTRGYEMLLTQVEWDCFVKVLGDF